MADLKTVDSSSKLKAFKEFYEEKISSLSSKQQSLSEELNTYAKSVESIKIDFKSSADDANSQLIDEGLQLAKEGIDQLNKGANIYLDSFFKDCKTIYDGYIKKIEETGNNLLNSKEYKEASDDDKNKKINNTNTDIDKLIIGGEKAVDALISKYSNAKFGIVGNMHIGGALGSLAGDGGTGGAVAGTIEISNGEVPVTPGTGEEEVKGVENDGGKPKFLGQKIGDRYVQDWNDLIKDVPERWSHVNGAASFITALGTTVYEGVDFVVEGAIDTCTTVIDSVNSATNWLFDGFNPRSGTTDEYWQNIGEDYAEDWSTFGETHDFWSGAGNISVGILRTIADAAQTVGNAGVTAIDWLLDTAIGSAIDWIGDALGWIHNALW